ncbi:hypothetical protein DRP04_08975 [Archaeoglobales archaeon]|nr:MAG: hypothetical protein DRP04_08975 [Archaeoglobales archaeon]
MGVKLTIKGVKEIIVLDEIRFETAEEFFENLTLEIPPPGVVVVNWVEGIVFKHTTFPWTETTIKEYIENGRIYFSALKYTPMKEYNRSISRNGVTFLVRKIKTPVLVEVVRELKKRLEG